MSLALDVLLWSAVLTLSSVGLTIIVRNAPWVRDQVQEMRKPWACNVCMPLYTGAVLCGAAWYATRCDWRMLSATYLPAYALTNIVLDRLARPPGPPLIPAEFLGSDEEDVRPN